MQLSVQNCKDINRKECSPQSFGRQYQFYFQSKRLQYKTKHVSKGRIQRLFLNELQINLKLNWRNFESDRDLEIIEKIKQSLTMTMSEGKFSQSIDLVNNTV